jgi:hypothetical protein
MGISDAPHIVLRTWLVDKRLGCLSLLELLSADSASLVQEKNRIGKPEFLLMLSLEFTFIPISKTDLCVDMIVRKRNIF